MHSTATHSTSESDRRNETNTIAADTDSNNRHTERPRRSTILFLRQFARCYQPAVTMAFPANEMVMN